METEAQKLYNALKDNPEKIIEWAKREIEEYEKLIELLTKQIKGDGNSNR